MLLWGKTRIKEEIRDMNRLWILTVYLIIMNIVGIIVMGVDKHKAKVHAWRIPEKALFLCSLAGGSIGTWAGMYVFHHKTKHWYFVVGMPLILIIQVAIVVYLSISGKFLVFGLNF